MSHAWESVDYVDYVDAAMMEQFGNFGTYNVIDGCEAVYSGSSLDVTVAPGHIMFNGVQITVAGNTVTLVPDGTNPRWVYIGIDSTGTAVLSAGTAAADPVKPAPGDIVKVALVKVEAGQTSAAAIAYKMGRRLYAARAAGTSLVVLGANTATSSTTLTNLTGFKASVNASESYGFKALIHYYATATIPFQYAFVAPTGSTFNGNAMQITSTGLRIVGNLFTGNMFRQTAIGRGATTPAILYVSGLVQVGTTPGVIQFQHAPYSAGSVTTLTKSRMELA